MPTIVFLMTRALLSLVSILVDHAVRAVCHAPGVVNDGEHAVVALARHKANVPHEVLLELGNYGSREKQRERERKRKTKNE